MDQKVRREGTVKNGTRVQRSIHVFSYEKSLISLVNYKNIIKNNCEKFKRLFKRSF